MKEYKLSELVSKLSKFCDAKLIADEKVVSITDNSNNITRNSLFVAVDGASVDGHKYIDAAFKNGASAAVVSKKESLKNRPGILVSDSRRALSYLAAFFEDFPSKKLEVIGVTGTNGKSTTTWFIADLLDRLKGKTLSIGTLGVRESFKIISDSGLTTPDPINLQKTFSAALEDGFKYIVMEASSHALHQKRVEDVDFSIGVFSNLTRDHLDYHPTMDDYFKAKAHLFTLIEQSKKSEKAAILNIDDPYGEKLFNQIKEKIPVITISQNPATIRIQNFKPIATGSSFELLFKDIRVNVEVPFFGIHNAYNLASAVGILISMDRNFEEVAAELQNIPQVPGRLEQISKNKIRTFIDYAHTPDALERALTALKEIPHNELWVVFGCGGDRDIGKRPIMGNIAGKLADKVIITSDNPRTEDPNKIIEDITNGKAPYHKAIVDRKEAIIYALSNLKDNDILLVAGKGHEDYQVIGKEKKHFSDSEVVKEFLK